LSDTKKIELPPEVLSDPYRFLLNIIYRVPKVCEKPVAGLFVGLPGTGKSHLLQHNPPDNGIILSDATAAGIEDILQKFQQEEGRLDYIVVTDLVKVMCRKNSKSFTALMNVGLEEGFTEISTRIMKWKANDKPVNIGLVTAITTEEFKLYEKSMMSTGFLSRSLVINFDPDMEEATQSACEGRKSKTNIISAGHQRWEITVPIEAANHIKKLATRWAKQLDEAPLRRVNFLRKLSKVVALINNRESVGVDDIDEVMTVLMACGVHGVAPSVRF